MSRVIRAVSPPRALRSEFAGYGQLLSDPRALLDLPEGFQYRIFSREGDSLTDGGAVPSCHDGMAAFPAGPKGIWLVRNHEVDPADVQNGKRAVAAVDGCTYDPEAPGGTSTLLIGYDRELRSQHLSLAGTLNNCAGGPTPWHTWLTCEESTDMLGKRHGYVFEVDPVRGGDPEPIFGMGRFGHEAVAFDRRGVAYLSEDAALPFGCFYRFTPNIRCGGRGSLHGGGLLEAAAIGGVQGDLSSVDQPGTELPVTWVPVTNVDPSDQETSVREQVLSAGATQISKAEGVWSGRDGAMWFVSSYAGGPSKLDLPTAREHRGAIFRYDPLAETLTLVALFPAGALWDGPDNVTASPHGFALACNDGEAEQYLVGINDVGGAFAFARNMGNGGEFAGATFSPSGRTLFVNIQNPGMTLAIWGPWRRPIPS
jgi:uncharacterized protein